jgi:hypothetical protein
METMSTATDTITDIDLTTPVPCQDTDCSTPAEWVATNPCCNLKTTVCTHHKHTVETGVRALLADYDARGVGSFCIVCDRPFRAPTWRPL